MGIILTIVSCSQERESAKGDHQAYDYVFHPGAKLGDWKCAEKQDHEICYPGDWNVVEQSDALFFARIMKKSKIPFAVILKHDENRLNVDLHEYLKAIHSALKNDTLEIFRRYSVKKLTMKNSIRYYGEFETEINNKVFYTFAMYIERSGYLYDFSIKVPFEERDIFYNDFQNLLFNFRINGNYLVSKSDEIEKLETVDLNSL